MKQESHQVQARVSPEEWLLAWSVARFSGGPGSEFRPSRPVERCRWQTAIQLGRWHGILPIIHYLQQSDPSFPKVPDAITKQLEGEHKRTIAQNLLLRAHLQRILPAFTEKGIPVIVLKGLSLEERLYPQRGLRPSRDMDLMVHPTDLPRSEKVLQSLGFTPSQDLAMQEAFRQYHHHLAPYVHQPTGSTVELHWHVVRPDGPFTLDVEALWRRAEAASLAGAPYLALAPEDMLLHLCLHFLGDRRSPRSGSLLQVCDIALTLKRYGTGDFWEEFTRRALHYSLSRAIYAALYAVKLVTGAFCPEGAARGLAPPDFNERAGCLFVTRRVVATGREVPTSLIQALAAPGMRAKARALSKSTLPPARWTPGGKERISSLSPGSGAMFLIRPVKVLASLATLVLHLLRLGDSMLVERWLGEQLSAGQLQEPSVERSLASGPAKN